MFCSFAEKKVNLWRFNGFRFHDSLKLRNFLMLSWGLAVL